MTRRPGNKNGQAAPKIGGAAADQPHRQLSRDALLKMLHDLHLLRALDHQVSDLCRRKELPGLIHLGVGEEAVAVGAFAALRPDDQVTSTHRAHGHFLAKGGDPNAFMAELYGKVDGCCRGKGGSMHLVDLACGFLGANGVVGGGLPLAVGSALGSSVLQRDAVTVCLFGDGANNQGTFHESLNLASVWNLPVVFLCENNEYGISLNVRDQQRIEHVADRAVSYCMPSRIVDGNNVLEVFDAVSLAVAAARRGEGPTLIECKTYRTTGHYEGDSQSYRPKEEVEAWKRRDPINAFEAYLLTNDIATSADIEGIKGEIAVICKTAVEYGRSSPFPSTRDAYDDVYAPLLV